MSVQYGAISWNRQKKVYDLTFVSLVALYLAMFVGFGAWRNPSATAETLLIRALGTAAFLLLNVVLCIGPLGRLDRRFLPLLYNRRHLGVTTFLLGLAHGGFALVQFHALGNVNPLVSLFISNPRYGSVAEFSVSGIGFLRIDHPLSDGCHESRFLVTQSFRTDVEAICTCWCIWPMRCWWPM